MHRKISDLAHQDRPREKLMKIGALALSDFELLQVIIGSGVRTADVGQIALSVQKAICKTGLRALSADSLRVIPGMSMAKISTMLAAIELVRRHSVDSGKRIKTADDVLPFVTHIRHKKQEYLIGITLDGADCVIDVRTIAIGTLTAALIHPREVFADAIAERAASIVLVHNHPSGTLEPSAQDRKITNQLAHCGRIVGIPLKDHIIVTKEGFCSIRLQNVV